MTEQRVEFYDGDQSGYFIVDNLVAPHIRFIKVDMSAEDMAKRKENPDARVYYEPPLFRRWHTRVVKQIAEEILEAAKDKKDAEPRTVSFTGEARGGEIVIRRKAKRISLTEQFEEGVGACSFELLIKTMTKLADAMLVVVKGESP